MVKPLGLSARKCADVSTGVIIGAGAYTPEKVEDLINKGLIDAVAFGRDYCTSGPGCPVCAESSANPAPESFLAAAAKEGYTDYPRCNLSVVH